MHELEAYQPELIERPRLVVGTKSDSVSHDAMADWDGISMSAVTGDGLKQVVGKLAQLVKAAREEIPLPESTVIIKPLPEGSWVEKIAANEFRVHGRGAERAVALNDVTSPEALSYIDERLNKLGVQKLLVKAGANAGDVVWIGDFSFEYVPDGGA
jgi:GTP-binding protein